MNPKQISDMYLLFGINIGLTGSLIVIEFIKLITELRKRD